MFAVVEHQQRGSIRDVVGERVDPPRPVGALQTQGLGNGSARSSGLATSASGTTQHPSRNVRRAPSVIRRATRVFPTPPGPTRVTTRDEARRSRTSANSALRPTNDV